ncbi:MAG: ABC transporter ATP-binding protein [Verrucomicrobiales bacterium]
MPLLDVKHLSVNFPVKGGVLMRTRKWCKAVRDVSLRLETGETLGLVGESGCGKSTLGKAIVRLHRATSGDVRFDGIDLNLLSSRALRPLRRDIQMIFQDPAESLNPRFSIGDILSEPFEIQNLGTRAERRMWVQELLEKVGLPSGAADRFPFEFSGGQRQRIGIARAIALKPRLIIADEPVSALDVSIQSQVLNLMLDLQREMGMAYLFIAHDLAVVKHVSDRVAVMYLGQIVELADAETIYHGPRHAYTKALLSAIPVPDPERQPQRVLLEGDVPSPIDPPAGSAFGHRIAHPRYQETVGLDMPLVEIEPGHFVRRDPCCLEPSDWDRVKLMPGI